MKRYLAGLAALFLIAGCTGQPAPRTPGTTTQQGLMGRDTTGQHQEGLLELGAGSGIRAGAVTGRPTVVVVGHRALISGLTGGRGVGTTAVGDGGGAQITGQRPVPTGKAGPGTTAPGTTGMGTTPGTTGTSPGTVGQGTTGIAPGTGTPSTTSPDGLGTTWTNDDNVHQVAAQVRAQRSDVTEVRVTINQTQENRLQAIAAALRRGETIDQHRAELEQLATQMQPLPTAARPRVGTPLRPGGTPNRTPAGLTPDRTPVAPKVTPKTPAGLTPDRTPAAPKTPVTPKTPAAPRTPKTVR